MSLREPNGVRCPSCQAKRLQRRSVLASDLAPGSRITICVCRNCEFAWQWPLHRSFDESVDHAVRRYGEEQNHAYYDEQNRAEVAAEQVRFLDGQFDVGRRLLDVGAGDGAFVRQAAKSEWTATGLDPAAPKWREGSGELLRGVIDDLPDDRRFDIVTLWDVIEHLEAPMTVLKQAVNKLVPGGYLVVETGNYQSASRLVGGESWWCYAADHRWYFSPPVVERMLSSLGLVEIDCAPITLRPKWSRNRTPKPWLKRTVIAALRNPLKAHFEIRAHMDHRKLDRKWPQWGHLPIFTMTGRMPL